MEVVIEGCAVNTYALDFLAKNNFSPGWHNYLKAVVFRQLCNDQFSHPEGVRHTSPGHRPGVRI